MREMKDSGIEWVGKIPNDWAIKPLYCFFSERKNKNILGKEDNLLSLSYGKVIRKDINTNEGLLPSNYNGYNIVEAGDIVIRPTDLQNDQRSLRTGLVTERGIITWAYIALKPLSNINSRFYHYLLHTYDTLKVFYNMGGGVRQGLNYDEFAKLKIYSPSSSEQQRIADFLDRECGKIDSIIADVEKQIELLEKYKRSIIQTTVSKGLDYSADLGKSKVKYVGNIPYHWEVKRGKYIFSYIQKPVKENDGVITCFRDGEVTLRSNRREEGFTVSEKEIGYQGIDVGDLIVHGMDGFAGAIGISDARGKASPVLNNLMTAYCKKYYMYYLRNMSYRGVFISLSTGIRVRTCDTNWGKLREIYYAVPPLEEQQVIADYLDKKCAEIDGVIADKKEQLDVLENYKKSLIYEYVTGKKEVV